MVVLAVDGGVPRPAFATGDATQRAKRWIHRVAHALDDEQVLHVRFALLSRVIDEGCALARPVQHA